MYERNDRLAGEFEEREKRMNMNCSLLVPRRIGSCRPAIDGAALPLPILSSEAGKGAPCA